MRVGLDTSASMVGVSVDANWDDEQQLLEHGRALAEALRAALPGWVERSVVTRATEAGRPVDDELVAVAADAGAAAGREVGDQLAELLALDVDEQRTNPLSLLRDAVQYPTVVLRAAGVPPVERDRFAIERFPDDDYDLSPTAFGDVDPSLVDLGIAWGAAKAYVHRARHRDR
jgi:hypothetical protein